MDCNVRQTESLSELEGELEAVKGREAEAKSLLSATVVELEQLKGRVGTIDTEWQAKLTVAEEKLSVVQDEIVLLKGRYQGLAEEHAQVVEARQSLELSAKGEASSLSHRLGRSYMYALERYTKTIGTLDCTRPLGAYLYAYQCMYLCTSVCVHVCTVCSYVLSMYLYVITTVCMYTWCCILQYSTTEGN